MSPRYPNICCALLVVLVAGCCPKEATRTQGHILVVIDSNHKVYPDDIYVEVNDFVLFKAAAATLLCLAPEQTFGLKEYKMQAGEILQLQVKAKPPSEDHKFKYAAFQETAACGPTGNEGNGKVGP